MSANFRTGWRQVWICLIILAAVGMVTTTYGILAVPLAQEFKPSRMVLMLAMTIMAGATAVLSPLLGSLMDRVSLRILMLAGTAILAAGFLALSLATSIIQVLVIYGVFMAPANVLLGPMATTVLLSRWFILHRGRAMGIAIAGLAVGSIVFPYIIQVLLDNFHWREAVRVLAVIVALVTMPAAMLVVDRPSDRGFHADGADSDPEPSTGRKAPQPLSARAILCDPTFWLFGLVFAIAMSGMKGMVTNLGPLVTDEGIDMSYAAYLIQAYAVSGLIAKAVFAMVADRLNPRVLMIAGLGGFSAGMACMTKADAGIWFIAAGVCLAGLFGGLITPMQSFLVPRIFGPKVVGRASGLLSSFVLLFLLSTPPIFGLIFDLFGNYDAIFVIFAGLAVAVMLVVPYIRLHPRDLGNEAVDRAAAPAE